MVALLHTSQLVADLAQPLPTSISLSSADYNIDYLKQDRVRKCILKSIKR